MNDVQELYDAFVSMVDSISSDEMRIETERAILDSRDSYILDNVSNLHQRRSTKTTKEEKEGASNG